MLWENVQTLSDSESDGDAGFDYHKVEVLPSRLNSTAYVLKVIDLRNGWPLALKLFWTSPYESQLYYNDLKNKIMKLWRLLEKHSTFVQVKACVIDDDTRELGILMDPVEPNYMTIAEHLQIYGFFDEISI